MLTYTAVRTSDRPWSIWR